MVLAAVRTVLRERPSYTEGHGKVRARLRPHGVYDGKHRVVRLLRQGGFVAPTRRVHVHGARAQTGTIITPRPDELWGTDARKFWTRQEG